MAILLFRLNGVPEDEAEEMRALLHGHAIEFYETSAGRWGISMAGLWLRDDSSQLEQAQALLNAYQLERTRQARDVSVLQPPESLAARLLREPLRMLLLLLSVLVILLVTILPFAKLAGWF